MNGSELYNLLREQNSIMAENFIFMSGAIETSVKDFDFFDSRAHPFLEKPFSVSDVLKAVLKIISNRKRDGFSNKNHENIKITSSL